MDRLTMPGMLVVASCARRTPCAHPLDRYRAGGFAARRQGGGDLRGLPGAEVRIFRPGTRCAELLAHDAHIMAREKVLHEGHPVAAVAATSKAIADQALSMIEATTKCCRMSSTSMRR